VLLLLAMAATGCTRDTPPPPTELADGSPARPPPVALGGVDGPVVATKARVVRLHEAGLKAAAACIGHADALEDVAVERVDVYGTTVTSPGAEGRSLHGCDSGAASTTDAHGERWCGRAFGLLTGGRLRDPRLSLGCRDAEGDPVGFAWVQPATEAAYVIVSHADHSAMYPVAGGLPVRVGTDDVDVESSSATFDVSEHARDGRRLRRYELEAVVAG
jgi:hypothetical protein